MEEEAESRRVAAAEDAAIVIAATPRCLLSLFSKTRSRLQVANGTLTWRLNNRVQHRQRMSLPS